MTVRRCTHCGAQFPAGALACPRCQDPGPHTDVVRRKLIGPALGLAIAGAIACTQFLVPWLIPHLRHLLAQVNPGGPPVLAVLYLGPASGVLMLLGGWHILRLQSLALTRLACVVAMLPCSVGWLVGLPAGAWGLAVLSRPETVAVFDRRRHQQAAAYRAVMRRLEEEIDADLREPPGSPWADE